MHKDILLITELDAVRIREQPPARPRPATGSIRSSTSWR